MNSRQRFLTALDLGVPDRVPTFDWLDEAVTIGVAEILGLRAHDAVSTLRKGDESEAAVDLLCRVVEALDMDCTSSAYNTSLVAESADFGRDKYGRGYILSENGIPAVIEPAVATTRDLRAYDMVSRIEKEDLWGLGQVVARLGRERAHGLNLNGPFQEAWNVMGGMDRMMLAMLQDPDLVHGVLAEATRFNKALMVEAAALGVDLFMIDGDLCGNDHPLISVEAVRTFLLPYKREMVDHAHALGCRIVKHTDGNAWPVLDDLVDTGFDGFHPVQPQCMDLLATKAHLRGRACVFGNVDCLDLLVFGTPEEVREATRTCIAQGAPGGGHVLGSSNSLHPGCRPENVIAMFEAVRAHGWYDHIADELPPAPPPPDATPPRARRVNRRRARRPAPA